MPEQPEPQELHDNPISATSYVSFSFRTDGSAQLDEVELKPKDDRDILFVFLGSGVQEPGASELAEIGDLEHWIGPRVNVFMPERRNDPIRMGDLADTALAPCERGQPYVVVVHIGYVNRNPGPDNLAVASWRIETEGGQDVNREAGTLDEQKSPLARRLGL